MLIASNGPSSVIWKIKQPRYSRLGFTAMCLIIRTQRWKTVERGRREITKAVNCFEWPYNRAVFPPEGLADRRKYLFNYVCSLNGVFFDRMRGRWVGKFEFSKKNHQFEISVAVSDKKYGSVVERNSGRKSPFTRMCKTTKSVNLVSRKKTPPVSDNKGGKVGGNGPYTIV